MTLEQASELLSAGRVASLIRRYGVDVVEASPLQPFVTEDPAEDLPDLGPLAGRWKEVLAVLGRPSRQVRTLVAGPHSTYVHLYYGSGADGEMAGCWAENGRVRISHPWDVTDIAAVATSPLLSTLPPRPDPWSFSLSPAGLEALAAAIDVIRARLLQSIAQRAPERDEPFSMEALGRQARAGGEHDDARWIVTLLRVLSPPAIASDEGGALRGFAELAAGGVVSVEGDSWRPSSRLRDLAGQLRDPLPAVAHELIAVADGELTDYRYRIGIRGEGPLWSIDYEGLGSVAPMARVRNVDSLAYVSELVDLLRGLGAEAGQGMPRQFIVNEPADLRDGSGATVGRLEPGRPYTVIEQSGAWLGARDASGNTGWVSSDAVVFLPSGPTVAAPPSRSEPDTRSPASHGPVAPERPQAPGVPSVPSTTSAGAGEEIAVPAEEIRARARAAESGPSWVYVLSPVTVRGLQDTTAGVGVLQPGEWYLAKRTSGEWVHVSSEDGDFEGWAPAKDVHSPDDAEPPTPGPAQLDAEPAVPEPAPWQPTHETPTSGLPAWDKPDPSGESVRIDPGVPLAVVETRGDWSKVRASNGWEGWVDGRRLSPHASDAGTPTTNQEVSSPTAGEESVTAATTVNVVTLAGAAALVVAVFLPWFSGGDSNAFDVPVAFLFDFETDSAGFKLAIPLLVLAAAGAGASLRPGFARYVVLIGGVVVLAQILFFVQFVRALNWILDDVGEALGSLFSDSFAVGGWLALAGGLAMLIGSVVKRAVAS